MGILNMAFTSLLFTLAYYGATIIYPAHQIYMSNKDKKVDKLYVLYFFIFGILSMLEGSLLYPVRYIVNLICACSWRLIKMLLAIWLQHPSYRGALLIEQVGGKYFDLAFAKTYPPLAKVFVILGFPDRTQEKTE